MLIDLLVKNWHLIILLVGYVTFVVSTFCGTDEKTKIIEDGKLRLKNLWMGHLAVPTILVLVFAMISLIIAWMGTSGECHPAHGWACETPPDLTLAYYFSIVKGEIVVILAFIVMIIVVIGIYCISSGLFSIWSIIYKMISRVSRSIWKHFPVRW